MAAMFIVAPDGSFVFGPVAIWRSKVPRSFRSLKDLSRPIPYFANSKAWMNGDIMESVLGRLDCRINFEKRKVILFLGNVTCHPESLPKLAFLPKNTATR